MSVLRKKNKVGVSASEWIFYLALLAIILLAYRYGTTCPVQRKPGIIAPNEPVQNATRQKAFRYPGKDYIIQPLADFSINARVLSREDYWLGGGADISPIDLALGWGPMSDTAVIEKVSITQGGRFYCFRFQDDIPLTVEDIQSHSANMHMIPANPEIKARLMKVRRGHIISLQGMLVAVNSLEGHSHWVSSLTRNDSGAGACEVIWVTAVTLQ